MEILRCERCGEYPLYVYDQINPNSWKVLRCEKGHGMVYTRENFEEVVRKWNKKQTPALISMAEIR